MARTSKRLLFRKVTISKKLLALIGTMVFFAIGSYLILAINLFKNDKISLIYELNLSNVKTLSAELDAELRTWIDRAQLLLIPGWTPGSVGSKRSHQIIQVAKFDARTHALVQVYPPGSKASWPEAITSSKRSVVAWPHAATHTLRVAWRSGTDSVLLADFSIEHWQARIAEPSVATRYIVDADGRVIAHPDVGLVRDGISLAQSPLVQSALKNQLGYRIESFEESGQTWLGAHAPLDLAGINVMSQIPSDQAFRAARRLIEKSIILALLILTISLFFSRRLAKSFTDPLQQLVVATQKMSRWELGNLVKVRTHDEIGQLALAFNHMTADLRKQRDLIEAHQRELEDKVRERTRELANAQEALVRTTRLASLGELAGTAAHEVLNPVNNMGIRLEKMRQDSTATTQGDTTLLRDIVHGWKKAYDEGGWAALQNELTQKPKSASHPTLLQEDMQHILDIALTQEASIQSLKTDYAFLQNEIGRITKIVNNMRSLARVGGTRKPMDVHGAIDSTAKTLDDLMHRKQIRLVTDFQCPRTDATRVLADHDELVQVFSNLMRNAMHAIEHYKPTDPNAPREIQIRTRFDESAQRVEITIADTGPGIAAEHRERVFEPDFTTKSLVEGTGLGLSISRRLIRAFGGDLVLQSGTNPSTGATFLITLPALAR